MLLMLIALLTAGAVPGDDPPVVVAAAADRLGAVARSSLIGGGYIYPALVQSLVVNPNQQSRELPYIDRNVEATPRGDGHQPQRRHAPATISFDGVISTADVESDPAPLQNVRLLNPTEMLSRFQIDRGAEAGLTIDDLDVDRYPLDGAGAAGAHRGHASSTSTTSRTRAGRAATSSTPAAAGS